MKVEPLPETLHVEVNKRFGGPSAAEKGSAPVDTVRTNIKTLTDAHSVHLPSIYFVLTRGIDFCQNYQNFLHPVHDMNCFVTK